MRHTKYFEIVNKELLRSKAELELVIKDAAKLIGDHMKNEAIVQLFGWGNNRAFSMELGYRAGGLIQYHQINPKDLVLRSIVPLEQFNALDFPNQLGVAKKLWDTYLIDPRDMFILVEVDTPTKVISEMAELAKEHKHAIILVTNSNHPNATQTKAYELADLIIDIKTPYPDTVVPYRDIAICQVSTIVNNVIAQMLTAEIYDYLKESQVEPSILLSANIIGADVHNNDLAKKYEGRYNS